jgi:small GTP-binding protein
MWALRGYWMARKIKKSIVLLGDGAVGKTCLIRRYVVDQYSDDYIQTIGTKVTKKEVRLQEDGQETDMTMMIWDLIGQKGYRYTQSLSIRDMDGALLIADLTRPDTLTSLLSYWIPLILRNAGPIPMIFLGNKCDLVKEQKFGIEEIREVSDNCVAFGSAPQCFLTSAKTGDHVEETFEQLAGFVKDYKRKPKFLSHWMLMDLSEIKTLTDIVDHITADFAEQFGGMAHATPFIKHQMKLAKLDFNNPNEKAIVNFIERLAIIESGYKTAHIVDENKKNRKKLFKSLMK